MTTIDHIGLSGANYEMTKAFYIAALAPRKEKRMGDSRHANGGALRRPLRLPDFTAYAQAVPAPGVAEAESTRVMGQFLRDVMRANAEQRNFRVVGPDETASNRLQALFEATDRAWDAQVQPEGTPADIGQHQEQHRAEAAGDQHAAP